jgi:hypothetical protein
MFSVVPMLLDDDEMESIKYSWTCTCGTLVEWEGHCPTCHAQPAWGCDCLECEEMESYWNDEEDFEAWLELMSEIEED